MGQYYKCVNLTKKEVIEPHDYNNGLKLMEFSWEGNEVVKVLEYMLATDWKGDEVYVCGDYADEDYYNLSDNFKHIIIDSEEIPEYKYIVNHNQKTYINLNNLPITNMYETETWEVSPLTLLLALGNGRGGGDFYEQSSGYEYVGSWCKDTEKIEVQNKMPPKNYTEFRPDFIE